MCLKRVVALLTLVSLAIFAGACGDSDDSSDGVASIKKEVGQPEDENQKGSKENGDSRDEAGQGGADKPAGATDEGDAGPTVALEFFQTPSTNIACGMDEGWARCDIAEKTWDPGPAPAGCDLDWGYGLSVEGSGKGSLICAGDTVKMPDAPVLEYGETSRIGPMRCLSEESGVTCENTETGHGFTISRETFSGY